MNLSIVIPSLLKFRIREWSVVPTVSVKKRKKFLTRGNVEDIGSTVGIHSYGVCLGAGSLTFCVDEEAYVKEV